MTLIHNLDGKYHESTEYTRFGQKSMNIYTGELAGRTNRSAKMRGYLKTLNWVFKFKTKRTTIGKHKDSDLCLQNGGVDECHALIDWCDAESCYYISDLNSAHGTYVNDCRIHNATVRLSPGDQLHFGYGGSTYELSIDSEEPFPFLAARSVTPQAWVQTQASSIKPHPPTKTRPMSAGSKQVPFTADRKTHSNRPGSWSANTERSCFHRNKTPPYHTPNIYIFPVEVERSHRPLEGCGAVSGCLEDESPKKDDVIACLKKEVSALKLQLSQKKQTDPEVTHRLCCLESDIKEKKEQIQQLKEQMLELQACSGEMLGQAVTERDQKISSLSVQLDKLKSENKSSKAMVSSLQKDLTAREKQALNLAAEVDKLRENIRHKDAKLTSTMDKLKEAQKHQHELLSKQNIIESLKKEQASLLTEMDRLKHLHQQTQQREQRIQTELKHKQSRLDSFHKQIVKAAHLNSDKESDQEEVLVCFSKLMEQMETYKSKLHDCDTKLEEETWAQRKMLDETQMFRAKLEECQIRVQDTCMADTVHMEISALQGINLSPALSWLQAYSLSVLNFLHALLHKAAQRLQTAGIDVSVKTGGVLGALQILSQEHKDNQSELRSLKADIQKLQDREMQSRDLQNKLDFMQKQSETDKLQAAERQNEIKNTMTHHLEEVKADLHSVRKTEDAVRREIETLKAEWLTKMEEAKVRETELKEKICELQLREEEKNERMKQCEEREMRALQRGAEEEREIHRVEVEEYREQVRQHAYTIVAMEKQINKVQQSEDRWREMEKDRDSLEEQLKEETKGDILKNDETHKKLEDFESNNSSYIPEEEEKLERTITSLRSSLVASQQEVAGQSEIINALSRDLAQAHARLSDMSGELSEQQKIELETHRALVLDHRIQLSTLTQKLTAMSQLVEQKDEEIKKLAEKLKQTEEDLRRTAGNTELQSLSLQTTRTTRDVALMTAPNDVINQGSKHKGYRREEMILQQKEGLRDMKERISALQKKWPSTRQQGVPERRGQMKTQKLQRSATRKGSNSSVIGFAFPEALTEAARERTARLDISDALELSEKTYLELARVLREALELSEGELSGSASLKHLPPDERLHIFSQRQTDMEFLRSRLDLQNTQSQQQDLLLEENQREINTLRESLMLGHQMQAELASMKVELETQKRESERLRQTLQDYMDQLQRNQQQHSVAIRNNQTPALKKQSSKWRIKNRGSAVETPKQDLLKEHQICSMVSDLAGPLQVPEGSRLHPLAEAH